VETFSRKSNSLLFRRLNIDSDQTSTVVNPNVTVNIIDTVREFMGKILDL